MMTAQMNLNRLLDPIMRRVRLILSRGKVTGVSDGHNVQNIQVSLLDNETMDDVERFTEYGLISVPLSGSQAVVGFVGAKRSHPIALCVSDGRSRSKGLTAGDSGLYHDEGHQILLTKEGEIRIGCKKLIIYVDESIEIVTPKLLIKAPKTTFIGDVDIMGDLSITATEGATGSAKIKGNLEIEGTSSATDHISGHVSGNSHLHTGVETGNSSTGGPQ